MDKLEARGLLLTLPALRKYKKELTDKLRNAKTREDAYLVLDSYTGYEWSDYRKALTNAAMAGYMTGVYISYEMIENRSFDTRLNISKNKKKVKKLWEFTAWDEILLALSNKIPVEATAFYDLMDDVERRLYWTIAVDTNDRVIGKLKQALLATAEDWDTAGFVTLTNEILLSEGIDPLRPWQTMQTLRTNMSLARNAAHMEFIRIAEVPYVTYLTAGDDRVRPNHAVLNGYTFTVEELGGMFPANGFNCRCTVIYAYKRGKTFKGTMPKADVGKKVDWNNTPDEMFGKLAA